VAPYQGRCGFGDLGKEIVASEFIAPPGCNLVVAVGHGCDVDRDPAAAKGAAEFHSGPASVKGVGDEHDRAWTFGLRLGAPPAGEGLGFLARAADFSVAPNDRLRGYALAEEKRHDVVGSFLARRVGVQDRVGRFAHHEDPVGDALAIQFGRLGRAGRDLPSENDDEIGSSGGVVDHPGSRQGGENRRMPCEEPSDQGDDQKDDRKPAWAPNLHAGMFGSIRPYALSTTVRPSTIMSIAVRW